MTIFRAVDASFSRDAIEIVAPFSLEVAAAGEARIAQPSARAASVAARMCAAIVKPTRGVVYIADFETRLQPPQAKRLVGFVDAAGFDGDDHALRCEVAFRADVWNLDKAAAQARATTVLAAFGKSPDAYERAIALALVADVALIVLDQPAAKTLRRVRAIVPGAAIIATGASRA